MSQTIIHFASDFFDLTSPSLHTAVFSLVSPLFFFVSSSSFLTSSPCTPLLRDAVQPFESVLQPGVYEPSHGSI